MIDYYKILQVDPAADSKGIAAAYRRLARTYHPDTNRSPDAARRMQALNEAYAVLRDPVKRRRYDRDRARVRAPRAAAPCPRDGTGLRATTIAGVHLDQCARCYGLWVANHSLRLLHLQLDLDLPDVLAGTGLLVDTFSRSGGSCPNDGSQLVTRAHNGVEVDVCPTCLGIWLDVGELQKIARLREAAGGPAARRIHRVEPKDTESKTLNPVLEFLVDALVDVITFVDDALAAISG